MDAHKIDLKKLNEDKQKAFDIFGNMVVLPRCIGKGRKQTFILLITISRWQQSMNKES